MGEGGERKGEDGGPEARLCGAQSRGFCLKNKALKLVFKCHVLGPLLHF